MAAEVVRNHAGGSRFEAGASDPRTAAMPVAASERHAGMSTEEKLRRIPREAAGNGRGFECKALEGSQGTSARTSRSSDRSGAGVAEDLGGQPGNG